jgi:group I intron endonuclease
MKKTSGIYLITNTLNNRVYVGHSNNCKKRWSSHRSLLKNNKHYNKELQEDYNNQSVKDFTYSIKEECLQRDLAVLEKKWKEFYQDNIYNVNNVTTDKKKIRRGKEAKNYSKECSIRMQGEGNPHNTKFNMIQIKQIKREIADCIDDETIANKYHTTAGYIYQIRKGRKWSSVTIEQNYIL